MKKVSRLCVLSVFCLLTIATPTGLLADGNPLPVCPDGKPCRQVATVPGQ